MTKPIKEDFDFAKKLLRGLPNYKYDKKHFLRDLSGTARHLAKTRVRIEQEIRQSHTLPLV